MKLFFLGVLGPWQVGIIVLVLVKYLNFLKDWDLELKNLKKLQRKLKIMKT